jgi:hypothetical protein
MQPTIAGSDSCHSIKCGRLLLFFVVDLLECATGNRITDLSMLKRVKKLHEKVQIL